MRTQLHSLAGTCSIPSDHTVQELKTENWNEGNGPVSRRSLPINAPPLSLVLSCTVWSRADCTGASKIVLFLFNTGVSTSNFQPHQSTL